MNQFENYQKHLDLLVVTKDLLTKNKQLKVNNVYNLLTTAIPHVDRIKKNTEKHALKFNVFSALGVTRKEVIQSRFLVYLLDPNQDHSQGIIFLDAFLKKNNITVSIPRDFKRIKVTPEVDAGERLGRMDIVIDCKPDWLIVIENKVDAGEQAEQLPRYAEWLGLQPKCDTKLLIFLTPDGREAETGKNVSYLKLSYLDIADALDVLINEKKIKATAVRTIINQYITTCRLIGGISMTQDKSLLDLLSDVNNIRTALEIEQQTKLMRTGIITTFGKYIESLLKSKLDSINQKYWNAFYIIDNEKGVLHIGIRTIDHNKKPNYILNGTYIFGPENMGRIGWCIDVKKQSYAKNDVSNLMAEMISKQCTAGDGWWIGYKDLRGGEMRFSPMDIDDIIACHTDNQSSEHPKANVIADEAWSMFEAYRTNIEALESFNQAAS